MLVVNLSTPKFHTQETQNLAQPHSSKCFWVVNPKPFNLLP